MEPKSSKYQSRSHKVPNTSPVTRAKGTAPLPFQRVFTSASSLPESTHASTKSDRDRNMGMAVADCSWSQQKTGRCHVAAGRPCSLSWEARKGSIPLTTARLP